MRFLNLAAFLLLGVSSQAFAQSSGTIALSGPSTVPGAPQITPAAINSAVNVALLLKADATNGVLTTPSIIGNITIAGASPTASGGAILKITNTTQPVSTNQIAYEINDKASYAIPTFGSVVRPRIFETDLNVPTGVTATTIHENFWSSNYLTGGGTITAEINQFHAYFENDMTGSDVSTVEGYEASMLNNGVLGTYSSFLSTPQNGAAGTFEFPLIGYNAALRNSNPAAGSIEEYDAFACQTMAGTGSLPTYYYCFRNNDPKQSIVNLGQTVLGQVNPPNIPGNLLWVTGSDTSNGTDPVIFKNSANGLIFQATDGGNVYIGGFVNVGGGSQLGAVIFQNATSGGISVIPPNGALGSVTLTLPDVTGTLAVLGTQTFSGTETFSGILNVSGTLQSGGTAGTNCGAGSVGITTIVVTGGIITHC